MYFDWKIDLIKYGYLLVTRLLNHLKYLYHNFFLLIHLCCNDAICFNLGYFIVSATIATSPSVSSLEWVRWSRDGTRVSRACASVRCASWPSLLALVTERRAPAASSLEVKNKIKFSEWDFLTFKFNSQMPHCTLKLNWSASVTLLRPRTSSRRLIPTKTKCCPGRRWAKWWFIYFAWFIHLYGVD